MAETYEETLEDWYYNHQDDLNLMEYFCRDRYLKDAKWDDSKDSLLYFTHKIYTKYTYMYL